ARCASRTRARDQLRLLAVELRRAEDECICTHLLDDLDLCRNPLRRQLQRLGAHAEDELVPAAGRGRRANRVGQGDGYATERERAVRAEWNGHEIHRGRSDEAGDERVRGTLVERARRVALLKLAVAQ